MCKFCGSELDLMETTVGIATEVHLVCKRIKCSLNKKNLVRRTTKFRKGSSESYALNCQLVLALMQIGCGNAESETMLNFLDLPHGSTFKKSTFSRIQSALRKETVLISDESMTKATGAEIEATVSEDLYKKWLKKKNTANEIKLTISYEMGWNKRSSGHKYDSISGHGFVVGGFTKKIMNHRCLSKCCSICDKAKRKSTVPEQHECPSNHDGSSKSMETEAIFRMVKDAVYNKKYTIATIISDDDSTMKANLKHSLKEKVSAGLMQKHEWPKTKKGNFKADHGRLPLDIEEPAFLADFNHRVKTVGKRFYELAKASKKKSGVDTGLARRMKLNWGTMMKQVRHMTWGNNKKEIKEKLSAPVEHIFGNHKFCGSWCYALKAEKEGKKYLPANNLPMYSKTAHAKMYEQLKEAVEPFKTEEQVRETLHNYDTQHNEAMNMAVSRYVPKFKHYGTTMALDTRVRCVIASHNMGYATFFSTLLVRLGCIEKAAIPNRLLTIGLSRTSESKKIGKKFQQKPSSKRKRKHGLLAKTKKQIYEERIDRANKLGTYKSGIAIVFDDEEPITEQEPSQSSTAANKCPRCGKKGHKTVRSKQCLFHNEYIAKKQCTVIDKNLRMPTVSNPENKSKQNQSPEVPMQISEICKKTEKNNSNTVLPDSVPNSTVYFDDTVNVASVQNDMDRTSTLPKTQMVQNNPTDVSTLPNNLLIPTSVHAQVNNLICTDVDSTGVSRKRKIDSMSEPNIDVELCGTEFFDVDETFENYTDTSSDNSIQSETIETSSV